MEHTTERSENDVKMEKMMGNSSKFISKCITIRVYLKESINEP